MNESTVSSSPSASRRNAVGAISKLLLAFAAGFAVSYAIRPGGDVSSPHGSPPDPPATPPCVAPPPSVPSPSVPDARKQLWFELDKFHPENFSDLQPSAILRSAAGVFPSNVVVNADKWISVCFEGRRVPFDVMLDSRPEASLMGLMPQVESSMGELRVEISADFPAPGGFLPLERPVVLTRQFAVDPVAFEKAKADFNPFSDLAEVKLLLTRADVTADSVMSNLVISPDVPAMRALGDVDNLWWHDMDWNFVSGSGVRLTGAFVPGKCYFAKFRDGATLVSRHGAARIAATNWISFVVPQPGTAVQFLSPGDNLAPGGSNAIELRTHNAAVVRARLHRVRPERIGPALRFDWASSFDEDFCEKTGPSLLARLDSPGVSTNALSLGDFIDAPLPEGLYSVRIEAFGPKHPDVKASAASGTSTSAASSFPVKDKDLSSPDDSDRRLVCFSDIGICARMVGKSLQAWVVRYSTAQAIAGAEVLLYGRNGEILATAATDGDGVARLALPSEPDAPNPDYLAATVSGGGYGFLQLCPARETEELATRPSERFPECDEELDGFLFSDRGMYRHGDKVLLQGLVRTAAGVAPSVPQKLKLEMRRPDGNVVSIVDVTPDERGFFMIPGGWEAPVSQPSGSWTAVLKLPGAKGRVLARRKFSVEAFAPPKIVVEAPDASSAIYPAATGLTMRAEARWQFGTPAAALAARAKVWTEYVDSFMPKSLRDGGWSLGSRRREFKPFFLEAAATTLGTDGKAQFEFRDAKGNPALEALRGRGPGVVKVVREATVFEPGGRGVSASGSTLYHPWPFYVAVRTGAAVPDSELQAEVQFVHPDGSPAPEAAGLGAKLDLISVSWESRLEKNNSGVWTWRSSKVEKSVFTTNFTASAAAVSELRAKLPAAEGAYRLIVTCDAPEGFAEGPETTRDFHASAEGGNVDYGDEDGDSASPVRIEITPDRKNYRPGDEAGLVVRAPFAGTALVTVQSRDLHERFVTRLEKGENTVKIPLQKAHAPSCEVAVTLIRPVVPQTGVWRAHRALGACILRVANPDREIGLSVSEPTIFQLPEGGLRVRAEAALVDPRPGERVHATFFLVDAALLELTNESVPNPAAHFGRPRHSGAVVWDAWNALVPFSDAPLLKTSIAVGGDEDEDAVTDALARRLSSDASHRFVPMVRAAADVAFDGGVAGTDFELPDFAGRLRLVVVAWSDAAASGAAASATVVPSLVADADGPRFLSAGDESAANCTLHNNTDSAAAVRVFFECSAPASAAATAATAAPARRVVASAERVVEVPAHGSAFVSEPLRVPETTEEETWRVEFRAEGLGERRKSAFDLPVRPPMPAKTVVQTVAVAPGETATLPAVEGFLGGASAHGEIRVLSGTTALAAPALRWLDNYQWACLEQTVSRSFPLVAAQGSLRALADSVCHAPGRADATVRSGVARVASMLYNNRFRVWPDSRCEVEEYSAWAGCFLAVAERERIEMSESVRTGWREAMRSLERCSTPGVSWNSSPDEVKAANAEYDPTRALAIAALAIGGETVQSSVQRMLDRESALPPLARARLAFALMRSGDPEAGLRLLRTSRPAKTVQEASWLLLAWLEAPLDGDADGELAAAVASNLGLLRRLSGPDGHWGTTSDNAHALLALAAHARRFGGASPVEYEQSASAKSSGLVVRQDGDAALSAYSWRNDSTETLFLRRETTAIPALGPAASAPISSGIRVSRSFVDSEGKQVDPLSGISQGDTVYMLVKVDEVAKPAPDGAGEVAQGSPLGGTVIQLPLPAGLEPLPNSSFAKAGLSPVLPLNPSWVVHRETRDDRIVVFGTGNSLQFCCPLQAVSVGSFMLPPAHVEEMYEPTVFATTGVERLVVASAAGK